MYLRIGMELHQSETSIDTHQKATKLEAYAKAKTDIKTLQSHAASFKIFITVKSFYRYALSIYRSSRLATNTDRQIWTEIENDIQFPGIDSCRRHQRNFEIQLMHVYLIIAPLSQIKICRRSGSNEIQTGLETPYTLNRYEKRLLTR